MRFTRPQLVGGLLVVAASAAVVAGILVVGSPAEERTRRLDRRRVEDLAAMASSVDLFWTRHSRLPASLEELRREPGASEPAGDPMTNAPYEYRVSSDRAFELCARFEGDSARDPVARSGFWSHGAGLHCFRREARAID